MAPGYFVNDIDPAIAIRAAEARARAEADAKEAAAKARAEADAKAAQEKAKALEVLQNHVIADDDIIIKGTDYVIQDFAALPIAKPTIKTYKDAGVPGVTIVNLVLVNDLVEATATSLPAFKYTPQSVSLAMRESTVFTTPIFIKSLSFAI
jgi:hypothetical protein